ncbi:MAG: PAS domain S-box protein [Chloroflexia bacterium]|nr:PAS domain S-box protein [Chloroflexia bacterium]
MGWFHDLRLRWKMLIAFGSVMVVTICLIGLVYLNARQSQATATSVEDTFADIAAIDATYASVIDLQSGYRGFLLSGDIAYLDPYFAAAAQYPAQISALRTRSDGDPAQLIRWDTVDVAVQRWTRDVAEPGIALRRRLDAGAETTGPPVGDAIQAWTISSDGERIIEGIRQSLGDALSVERTLLDQRLAARGSADDRLLQFIQAGLVIAVVVGLVSALGLTREFGRPLDQLATASQRLAAGAFNERVPTRRGDEIGLTGIAFNMMAARLQTVFADLEAAAQAATANEVHVRAVMDSVTDGILTFDDRGRILSSNHATGTIFGYEPSDLIGLPVISLLTGGIAVDDTGKVVAPGTGDLAIGVGQEVQGRFKDGSPFPVELVVSHLRQSGQKRFIGVVRDITGRKRAQAAIARERDLLRTLMDQSPEMIYFKDMASRFTRVNRATVDWLGAASPDQVIGLTDFDFVSDAAAERRIAEEQQVYATGQPRFNTIEQIPGTDGEPRWFLFSRVPLRNHQDEIIGLITNARDITEMRRTDESLRRSEARLRLAFDAAQITPWDFDLTGRDIAWASSRPLSPGDAAGPRESAFETFIDRVAPADRATVREAFAAVARSHADLTVEYQLAGPGPSPRWEVARGQIVRDDEGRPVRMIGVSLDLTETKRSERAVRDSELRLRRLSEATFEVVILHDHGTILDANAAITQTFGHDRGDLVGTALTDLIAVGSRERLASFLGRETTDPVELTGLRRDGSTFPLEIRGRWVPSGGTIVHVAALRDISDRKHAEAALHESWQRYRDLFQEAERQARELAVLDDVRTALAMELDLREIFRTVVDSTSRTFGFTHVSVYRLDGDTLHLQHHTGYANVLTEVPVADSVLGRVATSAEPVFLQDVTADPTFRAAVEHIVSEIAVPILDGERVVAVLNVESVHDHHLTRDDLDLLMAVSSQVNIAVSRAHLHQEVQEREAYFRSLVQNGTDLITVMSVDGQIGYVSPASERLFGSRPRTTIDDWIRGLVIPDDVAALEGAMAEARQTHGVTVRVPVRVQLDDGQIRSLETVITNRSDDPNVRGFIFNSRDVTEHREAETALVEQAKQAEQARGETNAILDASSEAMILIAPDGRIVSANRRFGELFDQDITEVFGRSMRDYRIETERVFADSERFLDILRTTLHDTSARVTEILTQRYPEHRELALFSSPVLAADGEHLGRLFAFRDVTQEREVDRMKTEFVSLVSHELRTPLTSIKGYVDLLMEGEVGPLKDDQREFLGIVGSNAERLVALINDLLDISRIEAGRVELQRAPLDFSRVVAGVLASLRPQIEAKGQQIEVALPPGLPPIDGDMDRLIQILTNLVANAHKYTPAGGRITISARAGQGRLEFSVADTGIGMTDADQAQLFTKFFRARNRTTQEVGGTGLGLTITRSLIELHGGEITVSSAPDQGSRFTVSLPTSRGTTASLVFPEAFQPLGGTILVVEDDTDIAHLVRRYLERAGYTVHNAAGAEMALDIARDVQPDLITLDVMLPKHNGFTLLNWLKDDPSTRQIPVMILSMMPDDGHGREHGADDYMVKPVHERALLNRVNRLLTLPTSLSRILVIDSGDATHQLVRSYLSHTRIAVSNARDLTTASGWLDRHDFDVIMLDGRLLDPGHAPTRSGIHPPDDAAPSATVRLHHQLTTTPVVLLTSRDTGGTASGAVDGDINGDAMGQVGDDAAIRERLTVVATLQRPFTEASFASVIKRAGIAGHLVAGLAEQGVAR